MINTSNNIKLKSTATFEGSLYQLYFFQKDLQVSRKQKRLIKLFMDCRNSQYFKELKTLTKTNDAGEYNPINILKAIRKNQASLTRLSEDKEVLKKPKRVRTIDSKEKIISDLKKCKLKFNMALHWLRYEKRSIKMTRAQARIIHETRNRNNKVYKSLKKLCLANNKGHFTPMEILDCIQSNTDQLRSIMEGKPPSQITWSNSSPHKKTSSKPLPLDTNYKYPTKTSKSIWTVKKR